MSIGRRIAAYGLLGVIVAGLGWLWMWSMERRTLSEVTRVDRDP